MTPVIRRLATGLHLQPNFDVIMPEPLWRQTGTGQYRQSECPWDETCCNSWLPVSVSEVLLVVMGKAKSLFDLNHNWITIWFKSWLNHMWWFDLTTMRLFESTWFYLDLIWIYHDLICDLNKSQVSLSYLKLLLKEYGPMNDRYCMGIVPNYFSSFWVIIVWWTVFSPSGTCKITVLNHKSLDRFKCLCQISNHIPKSQIIVDQISNQT